MKKHGWCIGIGVLLSSLLLLCFHLERRPVSAPSLDPVSFSVSYDAGQQQIRCWFTGQDCIVFLPSFAELSLTSVRLDPAAQVTLQGNEITDGMNCGCYDLNTAYELVINDSDPLRLVFLRSSHVSAMFINPESGDMEAVHSDRSFRERMAVHIVDQSGLTPFSSSLSGWIRGHGNSTWELDKKSYNLYFATAADLFGMGSSDRYVLISNAIDDTNLRNYLVYRFAESVGQYEGFAPDCEFVDLFLNGNYAGLYLLCEKPEVNRSRLVLNAGSDLFEVTAYNTASERQLYDLSEGMYIEIHDPDPCSAARKKQLMSYTQELTEALLSDSGHSTESGRFWEDCIDLDSWARKYLIEEIFSNADAGFYSQYYYRDSLSGRIFAGPCWDYDGAIGMFPYATNCFLAQRPWLNASHYSPWYSALWQKEAFRDYTTTLYREEFVPKLNRLLSDVLPSSATRIYDASEMNRVRWFDATENVNDSISEMENYLTDHLSFLNSAWIDGVVYHTITLKRSPDATYQYYCIADGSDASMLPSPNALGAEGAVWFLEGSDEEFDPHTIIHEDLVLTAFHSDPETGREASG